MEKEKIDQVLRRIAERNCTTVEQVRRDMQAAMEAGMKNPDPKGQAAWSRIPRKGKTPTIEELIEYLVSQL